MRWSDLTLDLFNNDDEYGDLETDNGYDLDNGDDKSNEGETYMV